MAERTNDFLKRLRERTAAQETQIQERFDKIMETKATDNTKVTNSPAWIESNTDQEKSVGMKKSSILGMLRGDVETKSSTRRDTSQRA